MKLLCSTIFKAMIFRVEIQNFNSYFLLSDKPLLMLQSIKRALKVNTEDPRLHFCLARFQLFVEKNGPTMAEAVKKVIETEGKDIFSIKTAKARNDQFMQKNSSSLDHRVIGKVIFNVKERFIT